jgi:Flp pilus assembly pilin Flp
MKRFLNRLWQEDDGVLSFEWVLVITVLVIGIVGGLAAARDAVIDELGDAAEAMLALDQTYDVDLPLAPGIIDPVDDAGVVESGASNSGFLDFAVFGDCERAADPGGQAGLDDDDTP